MNDGWHPRVRAFPGVSSDAVVDDVLFVDGKPVGTVEQFHEGASVYANDNRGRLGAFETVAAAKAAVERRALRVVR